MDHTRNIVIKNTSGVRTIVHHEICGSLYSGDRLIVSSPQKAIFLKDHQVTACYGPGVYEWVDNDTRPHEGELYFIDMDCREEQKWHFCFKEETCSRRIDLFGTVSYGVDDAVLTVRAMAAREILQYTSMKASKRFVQYILEKRLAYACAYVTSCCGMWTSLGEEQITEALNTQLDMLFTVYGLKLHLFNVEKVSCSCADGPVEETLEFDEDSDSQPFKQEDEPEWSNYAGTWSNYSEWLNSGWSNCAGWTDSGWTNGCDKSFPPQTEEPEKEIPAAEATFKAGAGKVERGESFAFHIVMFSDTYRERAEKVLAAADAGQQETESGIHNVALSSLIRILLFSPDIPIEDDLCEQKWNGKLCVFQYLLSVPQDYEKKTLRLTCRVYADDVVLTDLKMVLKVGEQTSELKPDSQRVRTAFASYSSLDRAIVAARLQGMLAATNDELDIFFDVESLRRGEDWEQRIRAEILKRSIFYLFWSRNARKSEWVSKELAFAVESKQMEDIEPIPLEKPAVCPPPPALSGKHFYDRLLNYSEEPIMIDAQDPAGPEG